MSGVDVYLDACCFIYAVEGEPCWRNAVLEKLRVHAQSNLLTSTLSRLECRTQALRNNDTALLRSYEHIFANVQLVDVSAQIIERATKIRAQYGLKTPDAIHIATALEQQATIFLTADQAFTRCQEITVELLLVEST
jgi:uncharacterized protein